MTLTTAEREQILDIDTYDDDMGAVLDDIDDDEDDQHPGTEIRPPSH